MADKSTMRLIEKVFASAEAIKESRQKLAEIILKLEQKNRDGKLEPLYEQTSVKSFQGLLDVAGMSPVEARSILAERTLELLVQPRRIRKPKQSAKR